jgi:hypothetical protein
MNNSVDVCKNCIGDDLDTAWFRENNWEDFNAEYCVTKCDNNFIPKHIPKEQVIKYLKGKGIK